MTEHDPSQNEYVRRLEERNRHLEAENRYTLAALQQAVSLGEFDHRLNRMEDPSAILEETGRRLRRLVTYHCFAFYLLDPETGEPRQALRQPQEAGEWMEREFQQLADSAAVAEALETRRPLFRRLGEGRGEALVHALATTSRVMGVFLGVADQPRSEIPDAALVLTTLILTSSAGALQHFELYSLIRDMNRQLEDKVAELAASERQLSEHRLHLEDLVRWRTSRLQVANTRLTKEIQERRKAEAELSVAKGQAEAASKAKSMFLANVSHEIRTPLNSMLGMADLLAASKLDGEQRELVHLLKASGDALLVVIDDLLDFSRIESGRLKLQAQRVDAGDLLKETAAMFAYPAREKGLALKLELGENLPEMVTDPGRLRQVVANLLSNAVKFTDQGEVVLSAEAGDSGERLRFQVADTGPGMTEEVVSRIFEAFEQADGERTRRHGGSGLGLSISMRLVSLLGGGAIQVDSEPGRGAVFTFELPVRLDEGAEAVEAPVREAPAAPAELPEALLARRVVAAEDSEFNRLLLEKILDRLGFRDVVFTADGRATVEAVLEAPEAVGLVLMDLQMPVMDGIAAARSLREAGLEAPIVALTAHAREEDRLMCLEAGMDSHVVKPYRENSLLQGVRDALAARR
jgi:signal transduction histidine kinase